MDVGSITLGRPWLFGLDVTIYGRSNSCTFIHKGRKIRINLLEPKSNTSVQKEDKVPEKQKSPHLVDAKTMERDVRKIYVIFALVDTDSSLDPLLDVPLEVASILQEFAQVFPEELPNKLPPMRDIQHAIDLVLGATLSNLIAIASILLNILN